MLIAWLIYNDFKHNCTIFNLITFLFSDNDEKAITAMGLLNTMETILTVMEDHVELHAQLEPSK